MINVQYIFNAVNDLTRKNNAGYTSNEEFNRHLNQCQDILMRYYYKLFEEAQIIVDSLMPFLIEANLPIGANARIPFPSDYRYRLEVGYLEIYNPDCGETGLQINPKPCHYLAANEVIETLSSPIRKPSKNKRIYKHTFINDYIQLYPIDLTGYAHFKYVRKPVQAVYGVIIDLVNRIEVYDPATSVNLEWLEQDRDNLVDLMLMLNGIALRETALVQWVQQKNAFTMNKGV